MSKGHIIAKSGLWVGFYTQFNTEHPFSMQLAFQGNNVHGVGSDEIGQFSIDGSWNSNTGKVEFVKRYVGQHSVTYEGTLANDGTSMEGTYRVGGGSGKFRMSCG